VAGINLVHQLAQSIQAFVTHIAAHTLERFDFVEHKN
jgi:hypothetical protein